MDNFLSEFKHNGYVIEKNVFSNKDFEEITLGPNNYSRITVLPNIWFGFQGLFKGNNLVMNLSNIEHDPSEVRRKELSEIDYKW